MGVKVRERKGMYRYLTVGLLTLLFSASLAVTVFGGQLEDATAAYERRDYEEAYRIIKPLAEQGIAKAQSNLGLMYKLGQGVPQDYDEAVKWYQKAAVQGHAGGQSNLGNMYREGKGVPQDYAEAVKCYQKAATQGRAEAQGNLGIMYEQGNGVLQDYAEAVKWYRKAAEQGLAEAQCYLGDMYKLGQGVPQDYILAHMWLNLAVSRFPASKGKIRDMCVNYRDRVAFKMTPYQIAEAQRLAREWKLKKEGRGFIK